MKGHGRKCGQRSRSHIIPSIQPMHFLFVSHQSDQPFLRYVKNSVWLWKKTIQVFFFKFAKITASNPTSRKSNQVITMTRAIMLLQFVVMSGSPFKVQASKFLLLNATAVTLCQGHGKVIPYISPDLYILCPKWLRFSSNGFDVRGKSFSGSRHGGGCGRNKLKT